MGPESAPQCSILFVRSVCPLVTCIRGGVKSVRHVLRTSEHHLFTKELASRNKGDEASFHAVSFVSVGGIFAFSGTPSGRKRVDR